MKKILSFLLLCLTGIAAWAQNPVTNVNATFSNTGTSWAGVNITVAATDASNAAVSGVTATVTGNTAPKTVSQPGTNCIVINKNSNAMSNEPLNFTISGLPAGSKFNRINLPMYAITGGGAFQQTAGQSDVTFKVTVIEGGNTLYENTITNFNVPQIQKGQLNDLLVYECAEDIVTSGGDLQVNFSISKGTNNNGMCMAFQSLKLSYLSEAEYTVNVSGAAGGGVTYDGHTYNNGEKITATGLSETDLTATPVEGYVPTITIDDLTVNVVYTNILNASINYTPLTTDCWSSWTGEVPAGISALDATNYTATNLRVIAKTCVVAEAGTLQSTFVYTSGNNRIDIVGVDVVDASGNVVSADYHNGFSGGNKQNHVYTVTIPAGTYTVRYITTARSSDGSNTNTNGHIDNVFTPSVTKTYTVTVTGTTAGGVVYDGTTYGNGETFTATGLNATQLSAVPVGGYTSSVSLDDTNITVAYTAISYTFETSSLPVAGEWQNGTKFYTIKEKRTGYLYGTMLPAITNTTAPATDDGKWAVIANGSYFQFMNKATQEVLTFAGTANDALASTTDNLDDPYSLIDVVTYLNPSFESGYECFKIAGAEAYPNDKTVGLAVWNSNQALWGWGGSQANPGNGDDGSKFQFSLVETLEDVTYTVSVVGAPAGETVTVTVKGETVVNNSVTLSSTASAADVVATTISGYSYHVTIDANANTITVTYEEATPAEGTVYTIKALFPAQYTPVYLSYEGGSLTFPTSVNGVKSYWVARASGEERPWKFQSGYGDGSYLDGNSSTAISTTGAAYNVGETTYGFHMQTNVDGISYPGLKYIGTWEAATHTVGHGKFGGAYGGSDSYAQWTTHYAIEPVPDVVVYSVVCANTQGGVTPTFANYVGVNVVRDGGIVIAGKSIELSSANLTAAAITGYAGTVSVSGRVITVTYEQTSEPIDVTYSFTVDGVTIGSRTITELRGEAPTVESILPSYVQASDIPATVEQNAYTIATTYTGLPFEVGTKQYYINEWAQNNRNYLLYSNGTNVKELKQDCNTADFDVNARATGTETESYLWTVGGDWLNGFTFMSADGYYMQSPSKNPSNSDQAKVTKTLDSNCYFEPFVQASSGKFSWRPMGGSNNFAHTSDGNLVMGFYNGYTGASLEATTFTFIEYKATQICPQCGEIVDADATVCPKCGYDLTPGIEITIGTAGYATIAYLEDLVKPEGLKVYYCIDEGDEGHLTPVEWEKSYIPAYFAFILEGTPGTYSFEVTNDYEEDYPSEDYEALTALVEDNDLIGNFDDADITVDEAKTYCGCDNIYVFSKKNDKVGFYTYVGSTLAAHKAFYAVNTALVNGFIVDFEGTEGINAVMSATNLKAGYDIQGRRINKVQKGINILSGKKIIK